MRRAEQIAAEILFKAGQQTKHTTEGKTMATTLAARGRMTKDLVTPYHAGEQVVVLTNERQKHGHARVGEVGTIRRIIISDPNDGDSTFPMAFVKVRRGTVFLHPSEFAPAAEAAAQLWARRQIEAALHS